MEAVLRNKCNQRWFFFSECLFLLTVTATNHDHAQTVNGELIAGSRNRTFSPGKATRSHFFPPSSMLRQGYYLRG